MPDFDGAWARGLLAEFGRPASPLTQLDGWSNRVWVGPDAVVRVSQGRFRDSFRHEAGLLQRLAGELSVPEMIGFGEEGPRQWLLIARVPGVPLMAAWPEMDQATRVGAVRALGEAFSCLHAVQAPEIVNPWLRDAVMDPTKAGDAYRIAPGAFEVVLAGLDAARRIEPALFGRARAWLVERAALFADDQAVLVHGDAHFNNVLWDRDAVVTLVDFEVATHLAPDRELEAIVDMALYPGEYAAPGQQVDLTPSDFAEVLDILRDANPVLFVPEFEERMRVYFVMRALVQCLHYDAGTERDPRPRLAALLDGSFSLDPR